MDNFKTKLNMNIIMDVLLDELHIIRTKQELISKIKTIFDSNVKLFINNPTPKTSVLELNKLFLRQVVMAVKQLLPNLNDKYLLITNSNNFPPMNRFVTFYIIWDFEN